MHQSSPFGPAAACFIFATWSDTSSIMDATRMNGDECDGEREHGSREF